MHYRSRIVAAGIFLAAGTILAVVGFFSDALMLDLAHAAAVGFLGLVIIAIGAFLLKRGFAERPAPVLPPDAPPPPLPYYTRNCPFCGRRLGLKEEKCPQCRRRVPPDLTCSAGEADAKAAEAAFAAVRERALAEGSTAYVWRAVRDDATCERCANNDGHVFLWEREPIGGHAGARARCRCRPEPLFAGDAGAAASPAPKA